MRDTHSTSKCTKITSHSSLCDSSPPTHTIRTAVVRLGELRGELIAEGGVG